MAAQAESTGSAAVGTTARCHGQAAGTIWTDTTNTPAEVILQLERRCESGGERKRAARREWTVDSPVDTGRSSYWIGDRGLGLSVGAATALNQMSVGFDFESVDKLNH
jgi:hypothetical protein